jgi:hypothetical protein
MTPEAEKSPLRHFIGEWLMGVHGERPKGLASSNLAGTSSRGADLSSKTRRPSGRMQK